MKEKLEFRPEDEGLNNIIWKALRTSNICKKVQRIRKGSCFVSPRAASS